MKENGWERTMMVYEVSYDYDCLLSLLDMLAMEMERNGWSIFSVALVYCLAILSVYLAMRIWYCY